MASGFRAEAIDVGISKLSFIRAENLAFRMEKWLQGSELRV